MQVLIPLLALLIIFPVIFVIVQQQIKAIRKNFRILADELDLQMYEPELSYFERLYKNSYPELSGTIGERYPVRIYMYSQGSGKSRRTYLAFNLGCQNTQKQRLVLMREGFFRKIGKAIGMQEDIEIRDEEFDNQFIIKSNNHLFAKQLLADPDMREVFLQNQAAFQTAALKLEGDFIHFSLHTNFSTPAVGRQIISMLELAVLIAHRLEEMREGPTYEINREF